tara:strand:- start:196 stop:387 length:192 start_codon:yes stop_codon:yes gene_type:complete
MSKFICTKCNKEITLVKHSIKVVDGEVVTPEAVCCEKYMKSIKENKGFGGIIKKPNGTVSGKF